MAIQNHQAKSHNNIRHLIEILLIASYSAWIVIAKIVTIFQKEVEKDWWDQLPQEVQESIFEGIQDIEKGNVFTHAQVIQEAKQKYTF